MIKKIFLKFIGIVEDKSYMNLILGFSFVFSATYMISITQGFMSILFAALAIIIGSSIALNGLYKVVTDKKGGNNYNVD